MSFITDLWLYLVDGGPFKSENSNKSMEEK